MHRGVFIWKWAFIGSFTLNGFQELKLQPFLNMSIRPGIIHSGTRLGLLAKILTGTLVELKRLFT